MAQLNGGGDLMINLICFIVLQYLPQYSLSNKIVTALLALTANVTGALMAFFLLLALARRMHWQTHFFTSLSKASYPIYLFHQQIIYIILYLLNGVISPFPLMMVAFIIATAISWGMSSAIAGTTILRPIIGLKTP